MVEHETIAYALDRLSYSYKSNVGLGNGVSAKLRTIADTMDKAVEEAEQKYYDIYLKTDKSESL